MRKIGLIGYGAIGATLVEMWPQQLSSQAHLAAILVRRGQVDSVSGRVSRDVLVTADVDAFLNCGLDIVIEAASHAAVAEYAEKVLLRRCELHLLSTGALADDALRLRLVDSARRGRGKVVILPGALAGFDGLLSMRAAGLLSVKYTSIKPVSAWLQTEAESRLEGLESPLVVFCGTAREASEIYPRNANLATAVGLAGIGLDKTRVELIADPAATENITRIEAVSTVGRLDLELVGGAFSENPKTSRITAMSAIAALRERNELIRFC